MKASVFSFFFCFRLFPCSFLSKFARRATKKVGCRGRKELAARIKIPSGVRYANGVARVRSGMSVCSRVAQQTCRRRIPGRLGLSFFSAPLKNGEQFVAKVGRQYSGAVRLLFDFHQRSVKLPGPNRRLSNKGFEVEHSGCQGIVGKCSIQAFLIRFRSDRES